ncbi:MAG: family 1 glycosylhydrolase, partial [Acidimicrobiia bacterium]
LWGASTAAYQVEGGNYASDWWEMEHTPGSPVTEPSGDACDHYNRYEEDLDLLAGFGLNAYRFGIEWSRIEPEEGEISYAQVEHYRRVLEACRERNIEPLVTFLHHTLPRWMAHKGGWLWSESAARFANYCDLISRELSDEITYAMTINQPDLDANIGYRRGQTLPGWIAHRTMSGEEAAEKAAPTLVAAHHDGRAAIRANIPDVQVGIGIACQVWVFDGSEEELVRVPIVREWEGEFYEATHGDDYVGVHSYSRMWAQPTYGAKEMEDGEGGFPYPPGTRLTPMGYEFYPAAVGEAARRAAKLTGLPVLVTENGVATDDDRERIEYIGGALESLRGCLEDGIDVRGYFHWSLLDNFEWNRGYSMRFGLVDVDHRTQVRTPKPSAEFLGGFARRNEMP